MRRGRGGSQRGSEPNKDKVSESGKQSSSQTTTDLAKVKRAAAGLVVTKKHLQLKYNS